MAFAIQGVYDASMIKLRAFTLAVWILTGCNLVRGEVANQWPTATTARSAPVTPVVTVDRALHPVASLESTLVFSSDCPQRTNGSLTRHIVDAEIDYAARTVSVRQSVHYTNRTGERLLQLVLNVEPNHWPDAFTLKTLSQRGEPLAYELTGRRLVVTLPKPLPSGCAVDFDLGFQIAVPPIGQGIESFRGFFGHTPRQLNLGHWLPSVASYQNGDWITREARFIGEQIVLEEANWDVTVQVVAAPDNIQVIGPGVMVRLADDRWQFAHSQARDFTLSLSDAFTEVSQETESGVIVELYTFDDAQIEIEGRVVDTASVALEVATNSLSMFADLFGPYRYERLVVIQGDFPDGMEFSGLVFVSGDWFRLYPGGPASFLTIITAHEVAHQWWYARVGNDPAFTPWLDEALATYSEYIYIEEYYPQLKDWWWEFRVDRLTPQGFVDSTVYDFDTIRDYINAVYLRGGQMLHAVRQDIGTDAFFDLLYRYAQAGDGRVATPDLFWSRLTPEQIMSTQGTREQYLREPDIVPGDGP